MFEHTQTEFFAEYLHALEAADGVDIVQICRKRAPCGEGVAPREAEEVEGASPWKKS